MTAGSGITHSERFERARAHRGSPPWHPGLGRPARRRRRDRAHLLALRRRGAADMGGGRSRRPAHRWACLRFDRRRQDALAALLRPSRAGGRQSRRASGRICRARRLRRARYDRDRWPGVRCRAHDHRRSARCVVPGAGARHGHGAGRRPGGRTAHLLEFRLVLTGAPQAGRRGLAAWTDEAARRGRPRVHPLAARTGATGSGDVVTRAAARLAVASASSP